MMKCYKVPFWSYSCWCGIKGNDSNGTKGTWRGSWDGDWLVSKGGLCLDRGQRTLWGIWKNASSGYLKGQRKGQKAWPSPGERFFFSEPILILPWTIDSWQLGTLGAGNHYAEIQVVDEIYDQYAAKQMGIHRKGQICVMIHSGSRGLGHQVASGTFLLFFFSSLFWWLFLTLYWVLNWLLFLLHLCWKMPWWLWRRQWAAKTLLSMIGNLLVQGSTRNMVRIILLQWQQQLTLRGLIDHPWHTFADRLVSNCSRILLTFFSYSPSPSPSSPSSLLRLLLRHSRNRPMIWICM